jgi:hypothetical protein
MILDYFGKDIHAIRDACSPWQCLHCHYENLSRINKSVRTLTLPKLKIETLSQISQTSAEKME